MNYIPFHVSPQPAFRVESVQAATSGWRCNVRGTTRDGSEFAVPVALPDAPDIRIGDSVAFDALRIYIHAESATAGLVADRAVLREGLADDVLG
ncbi:MAG: hypothetical protein ACRCYU_23365 [Nocardioides sp.]